MADVRVSISTIVNRSIEETFKAMIDPNKIPEWFTIIEGIRDYNGEPIKVGLKYKTVGSFMGREIISNAEVTKYDPPNMIAFKTDSGVLSTINTWRYEASGDGTKVTIVLEGETKGFVGRLAAPLLGGQLEKDMTNDLQSFKKLMEKSG